jgi:hypothetical protein
VIPYHEDDGVLELRWLSSTAGMTDDDFKATLKLFANQAELATRRFLLIDATESVHAFGDGVGESRDREFISPYNDACTSKFAFLVPEGFADAMEARGQPIVDVPATFPTAWFTDRLYALERFRGG